VKVGDLIQNSAHAIAALGGPSPIGTIIAFPSAKHAKEVQKVTVLAKGKIEKWTLQWCEVINES